MKCYSLLHSTNRELSRLSDTIKCYQSVFRAAFINFYLSSAVSTALDGLPSSSWVHDYATWVSQKNPVFARLSVRPGALQAEATTRGPLLACTQLIMKPLGVLQKNRTRSSVCVWAQVSEYMNPCADVFVTVWLILWFLMLIFFPALAGDSPLVCNVQDTELSAIIGTNCHPWSSRYVMLSPLNCLWTDLK